MFSFVQSITSENLNEIEILLAKQEKPQSRGTPVREHNGNSKIVSDALACFVPMNKYNRVA